METALITALLSAAVALIIFAVGRWHDTRVKQTDFLRTKLEELYTAIETINENSSILDIQGASDLATLRQAIAVRSGELIRGMNRPSMLARLYFPDAMPKVDRLGTTVHALHRWMIKYGEIGDVNVAGGGMVEFSEVVQAMFELKTYLQNEQDVLTKKIGSGT